MHTPEIEVLGHIDLFEDVHETLFFGKLLDFVVERDRDDIGIFTMVEIVPP